MLPAKAHRPMRAGLEKVTPPPACSPAPSTMMAKAAPNPAPWEIPKVLEEARGLRSTDWSTTPATPSPAPPRMAVQMRGRRMLRTTMLMLLSSALPAMPLMSSSTGVL